jgi:site-specific DNA recombinase
LRGRTHKAGSVRRISAPEIEGLVEAALSERLQAPRDEMVEQVETITVSDGRIHVALKQPKGKRGPIEIPWTPSPKGAAQVVTPSETMVDQKLVKSIIRAHTWLQDLSSGRHSSIEDLAAEANLHPKVVRQGLRLAFLKPDLTRAVLDGEATFELKKIPKLLPLSWREQHRSVG